MIDDKNKQYKKNIEKDPSSYNINRRLPKYTFYFRNMNQSYVLANATKRLFKKRLFRSYLNKREIFSCMIDTQHSQADLGELYTTA